MTPLIYNERLKLAASAINLVAIGMIGLGVTAPLVSVSLGVQIAGGERLSDVALAVLWWLLFACVLHLGAQNLLNRLVE